MTSRQRRVTAITCAGGFMVFLDVTVVNVAFPDLSSSFPGADRAELSWVLAAYSIMFAALLVSAGRLADVVGAQRTFTAGMVVFSVASLLCAAAPSPLTLILARALQGAGGALLIPAAQALLMAEFPAARRTAALGVLAATAGVAAAAGPPLGGILVEVGGWRLVFLVNLLVGSAAAIAAARTLLRGQRGAGRTPDVAGTAVVIAGFGTLALGIVQGPEWGWGDRWVIASFAAAAVLLAVFARRCRTHPAPVLEPALLAIRSFRVATIGTLFVGVAFFASLFAGVLFLSAVWHYSALRAGCAMAPMSLVGAASAAIAARLVAKHDPRWLIAVGGGALACGGGWMALRLGSTPAYVAEWLPGAALLGVGVGFGYSLLSSVAVVEVDAASFGVASGVNAMARQFAAVLGVALVVALVGSPAPDEALAAFDRGWWLVALGGVSGALAAASLGVVMVRPPAAVSPAVTPTAQPGTARHG